MQFKQEQKGAALVCYITGDIDINTAPEMKKIFDKLIAGKKDRLVVNFKNVNYVDSSGLATLVEVLKGLRSYNGKLSLVSLSTKVKNLFEITKLDKLFNIFTDEEEAIKALD